jgi:hypothetical protein
MRWLVITLSTLLISAMPAHGAEPVGDFSYRYELIRNGNALGNNRLQFKALPNGVWQFTSKASGTEGLASLAGAGVDERSTLIAPRGQLELFSNRTETTLAWKNEVKSTNFDKASNTYIYRDHKATRKVAYQPGIIDRHTLTVALMSDLRNGKNKAFSYPTLNKGKLDTFRFKLMGEEVLDTALGKLKTVRLERIRDTADGKSTRIWFAKERNYAPVMIQELDSKGDDIELRIRSLN